MAEIQIIDPYQPPEVKVADPLKQQPRPPGMYSEDGIQVVDPIQAEFEQEFGTALGSRMIGRPGPLKRFRDIPTVRAMKEVQDVGSGAMRMLTPPLTFNDIKDQIPEEFHDKTKDALAISSGLDISPGEAYRLHEQYMEALAKDEPSNLQKARKNFASGVGMTATAMGNAMKWKEVGVSLDGFSPGIAEDLIDWGTHLQQARVPHSDPDKYERNYEKLLDPEWWATNTTEQTPFTLSLVAPAVVASYVAAIPAGMLGLGAFGTFVMTRVAGGLGMAALEASMESGNTYEESIARGDDHAAAGDKASSVFWKNMALLGVTNTAELMLAFPKYKIKGPSASRMAVRRTRAATVLRAGKQVLKKVAPVSATEGLQERFQEAFQMQAEGYDVTGFENLKRLNDAEFMGMVFGAGFGGVGSVWEGITYLVENQMPKDVNDVYKKAYQEALGAGADAQQAELEALDAIAATDQGREHLTKVLDNMVDPDDSSEIVRLGVESTDEEGDPLTYKVADRQTGLTFTIPVGMPEEELQAKLAEVRAGEDIGPLLDELIEADEATEDEVIERIIGAEPQEQFLRSPRVERFKDQLIEAIGDVNQTDVIVRLVEARAKAVGMSADEYLDYHGLEVETIEGKDLGGIPAQVAGKRTKGAILFAEDGNTIIKAFKGAADVSTIAHELGHVFRRELNQKDMATVAAWAGQEDPAGPWSEAAEEKFARAWEKYLRTGQAPSTELQSIFDRFKQWLTEIYRTLKGSSIDLGISPEVKDVFDRLLVEGEALLQRQETPRLDVGDVTQTSHEEYGNMFETGQPVIFDFVHNIESATDLFGIPEKGDRFGRGYEPSGRYVVHVADKGKAKITDTIISGTLSLDNPLVVDNQRLGWKKELSDAYGGLTGRDLSVALINDSYDGVVTVDVGKDQRSTHVSEILDLTTFDEGVALYQEAEARIAEDDLINGITREAAGDMIAMGDDRVIEHISDGIQKHGVMAIEDAIRNQIMTEVVEAEKGKERELVRDRIRKLKPRIDKLFGEQILYQTGEPAPGFYSALQRGIESFKQKVATASQWTGMINKLLGIKKEEIEWSGVEEFLQGKKKVSRQELMDFLAVNNVQVEEVVKGGPDDIKTEGWEKNELDDIELGWAHEASGKPDPSVVAQWYDPSSDLPISIFEHSDGSFEVIDDGDPKGVYENLERAVSAGDIYDEYGETKFAEYQLPGGENYREMLLTLPLKVGTEKISTLKKKIAQREDRISKTVSGRIKSEIRREIGVLRNRIATLKTTGPDFTATHWDEPNVLAHVRFNERTDADGKKVLFIEEIQSDWHQKGRKVGYWGKTEPFPKESELEITRPVSDDKHFYIHYSDVFLGTGLTKEKAMSRAKDTWKVAPGVRGDTVPDAPFKKTWPLLAMKRMVRYAAENDFDKVAWTTGAQQAERYDLSKRISRVELHDNSSGGIGRPKMWGEFKRGNLLAYGTDGKLVIEQYIKSPSELADHIGKEAAERLLAADTKEGRVAGLGVRTRELTGEDLKVGGEGMKGFYDKILPSAVNKFFKKWGGKVGSTSIKTGVDASWHVIGSAGQFYVEADTGEGMADTVGGPFVTKKEAEDVAAGKKGVSVHSLTITPELKKVAMEGGQPLFQAAEAKKRIREITGQFTPADERVARADLKDALKMAARMARVSFREGKAEAVGQLKLEMREKVAKVKEQAQRKVESVMTEKEKVRRRKRQIRGFKTYFGLTDAELKKVANNRDISLMSDYEYKEFKDNLSLHAAKYVENRDAKIQLIETIRKKNLQLTENYRKAMALPPISKMTTAQLREFDEILSQYEDDDIFISVRQIETVDRGLLKGARTWREVREKMAGDAGVPVDELATVVVDHGDKFRWDTSLAEKHPFYGLLVSRMVSAMSEADQRFHKIESEVYGLAKASEKSRDLTLIEKAIPRDQQIMDYLEAPAEAKEQMAHEMTLEQLNFAHYIQEYFAQALEYLIKTKSLEQGRDNYFVHMRRSFLESAQDEGLTGAIKEVLANYEMQEVAFNILDDNTGNILPLEKFFQFSLRRTGEITPSANIVKSFLAYAQAMERKQAYDAVIPTLDLYAQSLTPRRYTRRGLETDTSLKRFVNQYINNKKGRKLGYDSVIKQGGPIDLGLNALRAFITMVDLGVNIPVQVASTVGEQVTTLQALGVKDFLLGKKRMMTKKGKRILDKYEAYVGRSFWEELTAPGVEIGSRFTKLLFSLFHISTVRANKNFLLGSMTKEEWASEELPADRIAELKLEMGRYRKVAGAESLVGSTSAGKGVTQYKTWAIPIARTVLKNIIITVKNLKNKPLGEKLSAEETKELVRLIGITGTVITFWAMIPDDETDKSFMAQLKRKVKRESLTMIQALGPEIFLGVPRTWTWLEKIGDLIMQILKLEEYESKPGYKAVGTAERQFIPRAVRKIYQEDK